MAAQTESFATNPQDSSKMWSILSLVAALGAATVAKKGLNSTWKAATGKQPPENPADPDVDVLEAIAWAAASGTIVALFRMLAQRRAATYYAKSTGFLPPGLGHDRDESAKAAVADLDKKAKKAAKKAKKKVTS